MAVRMNAVPWAAADTMCQTRGVVDSEDLWQAML